MSDVAEEDEFDAEGGIAGAGAGATIGSAGGPIGALAGAAIGFIYGGFAGASKKKDAAIRRRKAEAKAERARISSVVRSFNAAQQKQGLLGSKGRRSGNLSPIKTGSTIPTGVLGGALPSQTPSAAQAPSAATGTAGTF